MSFFQVCFFLTDLAMHRFDNMLMCSIVSFKILFSFALHGFLLYFIDFWREIPLQDNRLQIVPCSIEVIIAFVDFFAY